MIPALRIGARMFALTLMDHLRLTFGHVIYSHRAHSELADRHTRWHNRLKASGALLMLATAVLSGAVVVTLQPAYAIAAAGCASLAVGAELVQLGFSFDRSAGAHRACSARLWQIREQYRALLADLSDGAITVEAARERRDELMATLHRIYENAPPADRSVYQAARQAQAVTDDSALTDQEIDRFLPDSLHKVGRSATA